MMATAHANYGSTGVPLFAIPQLTINRQRGGISVEKVLQYYRIPSVQSKMSLERLSQRLKYTKYQLKILLPKTAQLLAGIA